MSDADLARWEAEYTMLQAWALGSPPLEQVAMVLALIAEVRRLRALVQVTETPITTTTQTPVGTFTVTGAIITST